MWKFRDLANQLVCDGLIASHSDFITPENPPDAWLLQAHDEEYYRGFVSGSLDTGRWRRIGFTQRPDHDALVRRTLLEVSGTVLAARLALSKGLACNTAGGTHHAHRSWGSGYTALNDLAVAALVLLEESAVDRVLICDLDVHQGDGTAEILSGDDRVFTFSMHCASNFPFGFKMMSHLGQDKSDLDIGLARAVGDAGYMRSLQQYFPSVLEQHKPHLVLYDAGVDVHASDDLGYLQVSTDGMRRRDDYVLSECLRRGVPVACVIGGGYSKDPFKLARRHSVIHHAAAGAWKAFGL